MDHLDIHLLADAEGHLTDLAATALADGQLDLLPGSLVRHADACDTCAARVGVAALRSLDAHDWLGALAASGGSLAARPDLARSPGAAALEAVDRQAPASLDALDATPAGGLAATPVSALAAAASGLTATSATTAEGARAETAPGDQPASAAGGLAATSAAPVPWWALVGAATLALAGVALATRGSDDAALAVSVARAVPLLVRTLMMELVQAAPELTARLERAAFVGAATLWAAGLGLGWLATRGRRGRQGERS